MQQLGSDYVLAGECCHKNLILNEYHYFTYTVLVNVSVHVCVRACVCVRVCACVRVRVCAFVRACVYHLLNSSMNPLCDVMVVCSYSTFHLHLVDKYERACHLLNSCMTLLCCVVWL